MVLSVLGMANSTSSEAFAEKATHLQHTGGPTDELHSFTTKTAKLIQDQELTRLSCLMRG